MTPSVFLILFVIFYQSEGLDINEAFKMSSPTSDELTPGLDNLKELVGIDDRGRRRNCYSVSSPHQCKKWEVCTVGAAVAYGRLVLKG